MIQKTFKILLVAFLFMGNSTYAQPQIRKIMKDFPDFTDNRSQLGHPGARVLGHGLFMHTPPLMEQYSPTRKQFLGTDQGSLYIREEGSDTLSKVFPPREGHYWSVENALWSPDGNYIAAKQVDDRAVPEIELSKEEEKNAIHRKYSKAGENIPVDQFYIIDVLTSKTTAVRQSPDLPYLHAMEWRNDGKQLYLLAADRLLKEIHLQAVAVTTGEITSMLIEKSDTYVVGLNLLQGYSKRLQDMKLVQFFKDRNQFSWMSDRSGYNQLYLYDDDGKLIRPLSSMAENGIVHSLVQVDDQNGWLYFLAQANQDDPYTIQLFKTNLFKREIVALVDAPGITDLFLSPEKDTLWVLKSALPQLMQLDRYSTDGAYYDTPWMGDFTDIPEDHFNYEYQWVQSADQAIKIPTLVLKPRNFDPAEKYPVVEYIYGAPFDNVVAQNLFQPSLWEMNTLAQSGFIVVFTDGRGTADRGRVFRDFSYGRFGQVELQDHIAALKQLSESRPYMDMDRIGIIGHSWGGHFALRALLEAPDFYKAGHINAAAINPVDFRIAIEPFMGCLPQDCPERYSQAGIYTKLDQLKAPLMIVHGTYDDDVPIQESYGLVNALQKLGYADFEMKVYDGMDHIVMRNPQWLPDVELFFSSHLK